MENEDLARELELEVDNIVLKIRVSAKRILQRVCQHKNTISIKAAEIEFLESQEEKLQKCVNDPNYLKVSRELPLKKKMRISAPNRIEQSEELKVKLEKTKSELVALNLTLDEYEKKSPKYFVPKDHGEFLRKYLARLKDFMKLNWKEPAQKNREKKQRSLVEWMKSMEQTLEPNKTVFETSMNLLIFLGIQVSKLLSEYVMLVISVFCKREIVSENLYKVECILRCLCVEANSVVINILVSLVKSFDKTLRKAAIMYEKRLERNVQLENEIGRSLLHLIIIEVLRLDVDFCYPHTNMFDDQVFSAAIYQKKKFYKDKVGEVRAKINELKKMMLSIQEKDASMKGFIRKALDLGIQYEWNKVKTLLRKNKQEITDSKLGRSKQEYEDLYKALNEYKKKFNKCDVPEHFGEPLEQYVERIRKFMLFNWEYTVAEARRERQSSLIEWMLEINKSKEQNKTIFDELGTVLISLGTQISKFLIEYFMLLMAVSEKKEVLATLHEVKTILRCLSLEENSIVINTFVSVVQSFETILPARTIPNDAKVKGKTEEETRKEITFCLPDKTKQSLLHLIIIEVFRLEVGFCSPHIPKKAILSELLLAVGIFLEDKVFKDKLTQINELNKYKLPIQEAGSSMKGFLHQALELRDGIQEQWYKLLEADN